MNSKKQTWRNNVGNFLEHCGFDWIFVIWKWDRFFDYFHIEQLNQNTSIDSTLVEEAQEKFTISSNNALENIIKKLESHLQEEDKRGQAIESKATTLQGFTALAISLIISLAQFIVRSSEFPFYLNVIVVFLYGSIGFSLLMVVVLAQRVIAIAAFSFTPPEFWFDYPELNRNAKLNYAKTLFSALTRNRKRTNLKATYLDGAQRWLINASYLTMIFLLAVLSGTLPKNPTQDQPIVPIPVFVVTVTSTPTYTPTITATPTKMRTNTPTTTKTRIATATPQITKTRPP